MTARVVLVDDHAMFRSGVRGELGERVEVVGAGANVVVENGVRLRLDLGKSYYSPRMAADRLIIAQQVQPGEVVGSLFGGVGPFALLMAKKQKDVAKVYSVELNPDAHHYAQGNILLNKLQSKVEAVLMDAVIACDTILKGICDRVCLPVPKEILKRIFCCQA